MYQLISVCSSVIFLLIIGLCCGFGVLVLLVLYELAS